MTKAGGTGKIKRPSGETITGKQTVISRNKQLEAALKTLSKLAAQSNASDDWADECEDWCEPEPDEHDLAETDLSHDDQDDDYDQEEEDRLNSETECGHYLAEPPEFIITRAEGAYRSQLRQSLVIDPGTDVLSNMQLGLLEEWQSFCGKCVDYWVEAQQKYLYCLDRQKPFPGLAKRFIMQKNLAEATGFAEDLISRWINLAPHPRIILPNQSVVDLPWLFKPKNAGRAGEPEKHREFPAIHAFWLAAKIIRQTNPDFFRGNGRESLKTAKIKKKTLELLIEYGQWDRQEITGIFASMRANEAFKRFLDRGKGKEKPQKCIPAEKE